METKFKNELTPQSINELLLENELQKLISSPMGRRTFLAALPLLIASCQTPEKTRLREGDNRGQQTEMTVNDEKKMTQEVLPQMKKDYPPLQNPELQSYISQLGKRVVAANDLEGKPYNYNFSVVDVDYVNAFALPAGTVFVTAPLIAMADTEAELAGVIGHEVGHIKARHTAERMDQAKKAQSKTWMYAVGGGLVGGLLGYGIGKLACRPEDKKCLENAAKYGAAAGAGGGLLIQKYGFMANSREDEMEADRIGFKTSVSAGFSKDHVGLFYEKLLKMEQQNKKGDVLLAAVSDAMSTHPPSKERVKQMNEMAQGTSNNSGAIVSSKSFERANWLCKEMARVRKAATRGG